MSSLAHPLLGARLRACVRPDAARPAARRQRAVVLLGQTDARKLHSSMRLFAAVAPRGIHFRAERLVELSSLVERLARVIRPTYIPVWLYKPIPLLDDDMPIERIAAGDYRSVARLISGLEDPGAS